MNAAALQTGWFANKQALAASLAMAAAAALACIALFDGSKMVLVLIVAVAGAGIGLWGSGNPRLTCLWLLILAAPLSSAVNFVVVPHMGGAGSYTIDLADPFMLMLLAFQWRDRQQGLGPNFRFPAIGWWWVGMMALGVLSAAIGPMRHTPLHEVLRMGKMLLLFVVLVNELVRVRKLLHLTAAIGCVLLLQSSIAVLQFLLNRDVGLQVLGEATAQTIAYASKATYMSANVFRVSGLLGHPNFLSGTLAMLLPVMAAVLLSGASRLQKLIAGSALLVGCVALVLTLSRSGWLAFALAGMILLGVSFVHPRLRSRYVGPRLALVGAGVLAAIIFAPAIIKRFTMSDPGALQFRYEWMQVAWAMVKADPLLGLGLNTFVFNLPGATQYGGPTGLTERFGPIWPVVHDIYLLVWAEQGTLGFLLFVAFHLSLIRTAIRNLKTYIDETPYIINIGCLAGLAAVMFDGIGSFYIRSPPGGRLFFMLAAMIYAVRYWNIANGPARIAPKPGARPVSAT